MTITSDAGAPVLRRRVRAALTCAKVRIARDTRHIRRSQLPSKPQYHVSRPLNIVATASGPKATVRLEQPWTGGPFFDTRARRRD